MKVLIVNTYDRGGAANACLRLHEGLLHANVDAKVLLQHKGKKVPQTFQIHNSNTFKNKYQILKQKGFVFLRVMGLLQQPKQSQESQFIKRRAEGLEMFSFPNSNFDITCSPLYQEADIINLHWVANFLDFESFFRKNTKPVVWTLHDMNPFTGGEHYLETFLGADVDGNPVSRDFSEEEMKTSDKILKLKQKALQSAFNLTIVAPSKWLCEAAQKSMLFKNKDIFCIPYGINSEIFQPRDRNFSRDILNIPKDKIVILFVAASLNNHRKGYAYLKKALEMMQRDDVVLCAVGGKESNLDFDANLIELGAIADERLMSIAYSAADVFVIPSLMDNLPNTVLESLMCGTPVIGFPVGGIPDMINHRFNGLMTSDLSSAALFKTIELFFDTISDFDRNEIRNDALNRYDLKIQAINYIQLYQKILNS
ncbi:glycosyltransferase involved in cell wall biosynthesis [Gelidibacter algens]|uniref:Glycosyltransferase involved in cell wall biosynthesis n=1 Tax=Gelidibacter algens TaxID=49280 RepID=A0A1A7QP28_9FLAO|nr:glycosyltransferase [Gelidibacter algens]OBX21231.1 hypothetical protein A9996_18360 [Gelidibacter algens]OBX25969.1 hypothetical protein A9996_07580 [Gelidibacter algens]RAJ25228.1 glycosyltransferase involved in cell wall biosynthesis [Gelidibacter algens]